MKSDDQTTTLIVDTLLALKKDVSIIKKVQNKHGVMLHKQGKIQAEHGKKLDEYGVMLDKQGKVQAEQGNRLVEIHGEVMQVNEKTDHINRKVDRNAGVRI